MYSDFKHIFNSVFIGPGILVDEAVRHAHLECAKAIREDIAGFVWNPIPFEKSLSF